MGDSPQIKILLADGHSLFRQALRAVLENEADMLVVAEARDGHQAVAEAGRTEPDVALLEATLPNCDGVRTVRIIRETVPNCKVLVLSNEEDQQTLMRAVEAGATGYLTKECPLTDLIEAARAMHRGEALIPGRMLGSLLSALIHQRRQHDMARRVAGELTRREREVLALLADGADNDSIAQALVISPQTARTHIQNILGKIGVHSRLEAAAFVIQNELLPELAETVS